MYKNMFGSDDLKHMEQVGISPKKALSQIEFFRKGVSFLKLDRPCIINDGVLFINAEDKNRLETFFSDAVSSGRISKWVPASGAASRMFKLLHSLNNCDYPIDEKSILENMDTNPDYAEFYKFIKGIRKFGFFEDLKTVMSDNGVNIESLISRGHFKEILEFLIYEKGLNYSNFPKGLIKFHKYSDHSRTAFEEHLVEACSYALDKNGTARIHFTVSPEHADLVKKYIDAIKERYETKGTVLEITYSIQKSSTNTIAVDFNNNPFRDSDGKILFRPGGHGALLENLNDYAGDIIFIKNIDNVVPDRLKNETCLFKIICGGYLVKIQNEIFKHMHRLADGDKDVNFLNEVSEFVRSRMFIEPPDFIINASSDVRHGYLFEKLNRPLRICGVVKNQGEPGGGPFWVEDSRGNLTLQIVESAQVDMASDEQRSIWESAEFFNPVDIVCGVRDYLGNNFDLMNYVDINTCFISNKFEGGNPVKTLELPGLWNGAMSHWNTIFIEVPLITFNPVKTVNDLLRDEHQ